MIKPVLFLQLVLFCAFFVSPSLSYSQESGGGVSPGAPTTTKTPNLDKTPAQQKKEAEAKARTNRIERSKKAKQPKKNPGVTVPAKKLPTPAEGEAKAEETPAKAVPAGTISKIVIVGNKKIEADAIRSKILSAEGQPVNLETIRKDIQEIFSMGFFDDIEVDQSKQDGRIELIYRVVEKPSISEIVFEGNEEMEDSDLREVSGLKAYQIVGPAKIREALDKIEKHYEDKGYFLAKATSRFEKTDTPDTLKLIITVTENDKVKVKKIRFIGNNKMPAAKLKDFMETKEGGFFSFITDSGGYKQDAFDRDVQRLNLVYLNDGYVQIKIDRPQVYVTPDKKAIYITIRVEEGEQFKVGKVDFTGDLLFSRAELLETVGIDEEEVFKYEVLQNDLRALQAKYGDLGYAYANPIPRISTRDADREVDITFDIDKGYKVYLGKINMIGNSKTRDKVIRRELRIYEGELYNETRKRESIERVKRLGFFEEVNFNTKTPKGHNDIMDIDVTVKERNTGSIQLGAGYSTYSKFIFNGEVNQMNFLGKGQRLGASANISSNISFYRLSFTEPYFYDTDWSVGGDLYQSIRVTTAYSETKTGGALRVGHPLAPYLEAYFRYRLDKTNISLTEEGDESLFPVATANGLTSSVQFTLEYDKRDDRFMPSKGVFASTSIEYAGVGGDKEFTKGISTARYYKKIFWDMVWRNNITYGFVSPNSSGKPVPFNELFLIGGANTLRGFNWFTVGRRLKSEKIYDQLRAGGMSKEEANQRALRPFGGTQQIYYQMEFQFPLIAEAKINGVVFYDVGSAEDELQFGTLRQDAGFGFRWYSPIGPLRFEWGFPIDRRKYIDEDSSAFQFAIGAPF